MTALTMPTSHSEPFAPNRPGDLPGFVVLVARRIRLTTKTASGIIGQLATPILWVLVVAPALASSRGAFNSHVDYFTFLAAGQVAFLIPFTAMFNGINVIVDRQFGVLPEILSAPIHRALIPLANAAAVLFITAAQVALIVVLGLLRGAHFHTSMARLPWFLLASACFCLLVYGVAETLALKINRQEAYGPLIPAIGVTPYFLAGALYPLSVLRRTETGGVHPAVDTRGCPHALRAHESQPERTARHLGCPQRSVRRAAQRRRAHCYGCRVARNGHTCLRPHDHQLISASIA
jgi:ABC-2 type transport system permease protein